MIAVIDAAALLCVLLEEPGAEVVFPVLRGAHMSAVNVSESCSRGVERGSTIAAVMRSVARFEIVVHPFDLTVAELTAQLRPATRSLGLSLGDRACLVLGRRLECPIITADRRMSHVDAGIGVEVRLIR